jgi:predicted aspartyl protease
LANEETVIYPLAIMKINGVTVRALLDTGAGSSYISSGLQKYLKLTEFKTRNKSIQMMFTSKDSSVKLYTVNINNNRNERVFSNVPMTRVDRHELLMIQNPR